MSEFLKESWQRLATTEHGEPRGPDRAVKICMRVKEEVEKVPELKEIFDRITEKAARYKRVVESVKSKLRTSSAEETESSDKKQRLIHNSIIDEINLLSRECKKRGLNNEWRREIGLRRQQVGEWALKIADIENENEK